VQCPISPHERFVVHKKVPNAKQMVNWFVCRLVFTRNSLDLAVADYDGLAAAWVALCEVGKCERPCGSTALAVVIQFIRCYIKNFSPFRFIVRQVAFSVQNMVIRWFPMLEVPGSIPPHAFFLPPFSQLYLYKWWRPWERYKMPAVKPSFTLVRAGTHPSQ